MVSRRTCLVGLPLGVAALALQAPDSLVRSWLPPAAAAIPDPSILTERKTPDPAAVAAGAAAVRAFTVDLYRDLASTSPGANNLVCSPYSAVIALAMARAGARGTTAAEMDAVLHAPEPRPQALDAGLNALDQLLLTSYRAPASSGEQYPRLDTANALWTQADLTLQTAFLQTLALYYGAGENAVDFRRATEAARLSINAWVEARTGGRIPELLAPGVVTPLTCLVLTNAIYLKASWEYPFPEETTKPAPFLLDSGQTVTVPMMASPTCPLGYCESDGWQAVDLPYVGGTPAAGLAMAIVVPTSGTLADLEGKLDEQWLHRLLAGFVSTPTRISLPRWTSRLPVELGDLLARLGMPTAFSAKADFTGMCSDGDLHISRVVHEAFIAVDEKGTEAAAATAVVINRKAASATVACDRPFLYVIHDVATATPLFIGRVTNPTVEGSTTRP